MHSETTFRLFPFINIQNNGLKKFTISIAFIFLTGFVLTAQICDGVTIGDSCDDSDPCTENTTIQADCSCGGGDDTTPVINNFEYTDNSGNASDDVICHNETVFFGVSASSTPSTTSLNYSWIADPAGNATFFGGTNGVVANVALINNSSTQVPVKITVTVSNIAGCSVSESVTLMANPSIQIAEIQRIEASGSPNDGGVCFGDDITFNALVAPAGDYDYQWDNGFDTNPITVAPPYDNSTSNYTLQITDAFGCTDTDLTTAKGFTDIVVSADPVVDCTNGDAILLTVMGGNPTPSGYLFFDPADNPIGQFQSSPWSRAVFVSGTYDFLIKDEKGCSETASATIILPGDSDGDGTRDDCDLCEGFDDGLDNDNDGIPDGCDPDYCEQLDLSIGDACNDDNPNTENDQVQSDCSCAGESVSEITCSATIHVKNKTIQIKGLVDHETRVAVYRIGYSRIYKFNCKKNCRESVNINRLHLGDYRVNIQTFDEEGNAICQIDEPVKVKRGAGSRAVFSLSAQLENRRVQLDWITNTEYMNKTFIIERSSDGIEFEGITEQTSLFDTEYPREYSARDSHAQEGANYYRLKKVHHDGSFTYTATTKVLIDFDLSGVVLFPNPTNQNAYIDFGKLAGRRGTMKVYNTYGQLLFEKDFETLPTQPFSLQSENLESGVYFLNLKVEGRRQLSRKLIIDRL